MSMRMVAVMLLGLLAAPAVQADSPPVATPESLKLEPAEFLASRDAIEKEIRGSAVFRELDLAERKEVTRALDRMERVLTGIDSIDALDPPVRTQLFNDQELVNNLLTRAQSDDQVVCQRTKRVGSKLYSNTCLTVGDRRRSKESVQEEIQRLQRQWPEVVE
jgi:hypothetical protein